MFDLQNSWDIYLGQHLQAIKDRFPHHEDFKKPADAPKEHVTPWWCAMRNSFLKRCKKFQAAYGDDVAFGIERVVPLYEKNSLAICPVIFGDPIAAVDQKSVLLEKVQKETNREAKEAKEELKQLKHGMVRGDGLRLAAKLERRTLDMLFVLRSDDPTSEWRKNGKKPTGKFRSLGERVYDMYIKMSCLKSLALTSNIQRLHLRTSLSYSGTMQRLTKVEPHQDSNP
ncbi:hypothetical protein IV203_027439 [Nitzschia inconspicua]|uniref:Uncharacterized protein n=1 Tax=Nitzschia inconspicua TaxID=303405 RepID=A0A9K3LX98_9STRA|nr:hypothetical protein IV203_027439 [Nitzschia inconspicua]